MQLSICLPETPLTVTPEQFLAIAVANPDLRLERTENGELIVNPPTGSESSRRNLSITAQLWNWAENHSELGVAFESSCGFRLPNGSTRAPDASWVRRERWESLSPAEKEGLAPLCPDFVVELRSKTDSLSTLQEKMREYMENGARLGWLIDPQNCQVEIYRSTGKTVEILQQPDTLSGEDILPDFLLSLNRIWP
ncbi:Uma2 family endonuclease [Synechocystis sp. PCC 7338]|uniref:Uma2 family endonuclease n=1 Tax=Synechocystis sp. PCC 7338 TaxID=2732530 RepID=UPI001BB0BD64|nr:Uma2 family endonuclease [Synechocystis sp. PCC 7338]QUS59907.1 Uma2 family endonuclease [Synechocystis sp. PCC 7338]